MNVLLRSAWNVYKTEGLRSLAIESLRYLSMYYTPDKIAKYWLHKLAGTDWVMREVQGSLMLLNLKEGGIHVDLYLNGIREPRATRYLQSILKPYMRVIDVGANIGYYALMEARKVDEVVAFEPVPANFETLEMNADLNNYSNIHLLNKAVGDREGTIGFTLSKASNWHRVSTSEGDIDVSMITLDSVMLDEIDFLRMDVEGYELNVLKGAEGILKDSKPGMFIEVHNQILNDYGYTAKEFYEFLAQYDYSIAKSFVMAPTTEGPTGKVADILKDKEAFNALAIKSIASHVFFRR